MYVDSCLFWEGTVLLSNSLIPQIREILDFSARSADASLELISSLISEDSLSTPPSRRTASTAASASCATRTSTTSLLPRVLKLYGNILFHLRVRLYGSLCTRAHLRLARRCAEQESAKTPQPRTFEGSVPKKCGEGSPEHRFGCGSTRWQPP